MKFGIQTSQAHHTWEEMLAFWQELDRNSPFDSLWTVDHYLTGFGSPADAGGPYMDGWALLAALAQATSRLRVGILVNAVTFRHPAVVAKMGTTIDHISGGRFSLGMGAAWHVLEHRAYGFPFPSARERLERLEEAVHYIKLLWTSDGPVSWRGRYYELNEAPFSPRNLQQPHPPIVVGGGGERRTLRIAARYGDAMNCMGSPETLRHKAEVMRQHCQSVGRDASQVRVTALVPFLPPDAEPERRERIVRMFAFGRGEEEARRLVLAGEPDEMLERLHQYVEAGVEEVYLQPYVRLRPRPFLDFAERVLSRLG